MNRTASELRGAWSTVHAAYPGGSGGVERPPTRAQGPAARLDCAVSTPGGAPRIPPPPPPLLLPPGAEDWPSFALSPARAPLPRSARRARGHARRDLVSPAGEAHPLVLAAEGVVGSAGWRRELRRHGTCSSGGVARQSVTSLAWSRRFFKEARGCLTRKESKQRI